MNANKPESLFQSMEKWIDLYRELHECSHNEAHDAFEDWAEKLRGESADQTTSLFHEAVKASYQEMKAKTDKGIVILNSPAEPKAVSYTNTKGETVTSKPLRSLFGGPLLETGQDPLAFGEPQTPLPETVPVEELRRQAVMTLERNQAYLQNPELFYDGLADEAKEAVATAEARIKMLDGVIERQKERSGNKLTLKRK